MAKTITVSYDIENPDEVSVDIAGAVGKGCHAIQEAFKKDFGGESKRLVQKPEYHKPLTKNVSITR